MFARDRAKSYLQWGLDKPAAAPARALIENIANPAAGGVPVLMHTRAVPPAPGEDATGGYSVYLGKGTSAEARFHAKVSSNLPPKLLACSCQAES